MMTALSERLHSITQLGSHVTHQSHATYLNRILQEYQKKSAMLQQK
jgi:hypothetical protein